jgi:ADP-ribose pyrophosphatase YjhB (NUDIX family)
MATERFTVRAAVYLVLFKEGKTLLLRRFTTGWQDGMYSMVGGHIDAGETVLDALIREAREESGVEVTKENIRVAHTMYRKSDEADYVDFFIVADSWKGEPTITEPDKCDDLSWFSILDLPENTLPYIKEAIAYCQNGVTFSEFGWNE